MIYPLHVDKDSKTIIRDSHSALVAVVCGKDAEEIAKHIVVVMNIDGWEGKDD